MDRRRILWIALAAGLVVAVLRAQPPAALEIAVRDRGVHAMLRIGFASVSLVFDSAQDCSKPGSCAAALR